MSKELKDIKKELDTLLAWAYLGNENHPEILYKYGFLIGFLCRLALDDTSVLVRIRRRSFQMANQKRPN